MRSCRRPSTHRRTSANTRSAGLRSVERSPLSQRLTLVKSRMVPYHALSTCPLPWSEHLLSRLAAAHHLFHPLPSLPLPQHPQRLPSLGYPSLCLLLVKLVKPFYWMLPSYFQWPCYTYLAKNTSHRKWYYPLLPTASKLYFQGRPVSYFAGAF